MKCFSSVQIPSKEEKSAEKVKDAPAETTFEGEISNISNDGACLVSTHELKINELLRVAFPFNNVISPYVTSPRTLAEVRWIHPIGQGQFHSGLRFLL
ncbi:MAG TPA: PilZ domain-containing protein [Nitrospiria bacterium]|nr:PilZ domain-containing protein [Nitrospiria bacterium]